MQTSFRILVALASLLLAAPALRAQPFMEPSELRRGMSGFGLTTFQGTEIDTFQVEILGVLKGYLGPRMDMILARFSGGPLEHTGLIRGMSGSPVYIDGRLIGAIAYGWSFSKDPIGGITPIAHMLDVATREHPPPSQYGKVLDLDEETTRLLGGKSVSTLAPLGMPIALAGFSPRGRQVLRDALDAPDIQLLDSPTGQGLSDQEVPFAPGAPLAVQLIRGDYSAATIGTLTWVGDGRFVGFGHPMFFLGATNLPATGAYIHQVIPIQAFSFKLGTPTNVMGAVRQDRLPAIAGTLGEAPDMLPVRVALRSAADDHNFRCEVLRHPELSASLVRSVLFNSLETAEKLFGDATLRMRSRIALADGRTVEREQMYSSGVALLRAVIDAVQPVGVLLNNPFAGLTLDSLHFELEIGETLAQARITGLRLSPPEPKVGQRVSLQATLQPYRAEPVIERLELSLPAHLEPGPFVVRVGSGAASTRWEAARQPDAFVPRNTADLLALLERTGAADELVVEVFRAEPGFTVNGRELPGLPPSALAVLGADRSAGHLGPVQGEVVLRRTLTTDYVLSGEQSLDITLRKP
ncbi:MAG: hypothetical protein OXI72_11670 [Gemmatimonadota bacterium]|nr:hypothetical protein [Gemmatimonadota bacterium]